jgi:hypothetical protein
MEMLMKFRVLEVGPSLRSDVDHRGDDGRQHGTEVLLDDVARFLLRPIEQTVHQVGHDRAHLRFELVNAFDGESTIDRAAQFGMQRRVERLRPSPSPKMCRAQYRREHRAAVRGREQPRQVSASVDPGCCPDRAHVPTAPGGAATVR